MLEMRDSAKATDFPIRIHDDASFVEIEIQSAKSPKDDKQVAFIRLDIWVPKSFMFVEQPSYAIVFSVEDFVLFSRALISGQHSWHGKTNFLYGTKISALPIPPFPLKWREVKLSVWVFPIFYWTFNILLSAKIVTGIHDAGSKLENMLNEKV